jgi:hemin uptake protein HemP
MRVPSRDNVPLATSPSDGSACGSPGTSLSEKRINSTELFGGAREVLIEHSGVLYRLRHTSQGKLILTK